jgi:hypothetical protein
MSRNCLEQCPVIKLAEAGKLAADMSMALFPSSDTFTHLQAESILQKSLDASLECSGPVIKDNPRSRRFFSRLLSARQEFICPQTLKKKLNFIFKHPNLENN